MKERYDYTLDVPCHLRYVITGGTLKEARFILSIKHMYYDYDVIFDGDEDTNYQNAICIKSVKVEEENNMKSKKEIKETLEELKDGDYNEPDDVILGWIEALEYVLGDNDEV